MFRVRNPQIIEKINNIVKISFMDKNKLIF
jgi:hypothetical protein